VISHRQATPPPAACRLAASQTRVRLRVGPRCRFA
jgi:hypothetical protein